MQNSVEHLHFLIEVKIAFKQVKNLKEFPEQDRMVC